MEQRELLEEAKRLLETGELFPRGTAEEPHAPDEASDSEPEAHVMEPLADDHSSDAPTGVEESAAPAAPAVAAAPKRAAMSLLERLQAIRIKNGEHTTNVTALCLCVVRKLSSASPARAHVRVCCFHVHPFHLCLCCVHLSSPIRQFHRLHSE